MSDIQPPGTLSSSCRERSGKCSDSGECGPQPGERGAVASRAGGVAGVEQEAPAAFLFTVFTPTHNRKLTLPRVYESLCRQTLRDFEWLIVDDGSTDDTEELVAAWQREGSLDIRYVWQERGHKKSAFNHGVRLARGELFLSLDSDDACVPEALERFAHHWRSIPDERRDGFSAVTALCQDEDGNLVGDRFPLDVLDSNPMELRYVHRVAGEKWGFQRTAVLRQFPFPETVPGLVPEDVVWAPIGRAYATRYVNEELRIYHAPPPGVETQLSKSIDFRAMAPGHVEWMLSVLTVELPYFRHSPWSFLRSAALLVRFCSHLGCGSLRSLRRLRSWFALSLVLIAAPWGLLLYCRDRLVMLKKRLWGAKC